MSLYLIAHKVRGLPAFDIAERQRCPVCEGARQGLDNGADYAGNCNACDDGYWWIIPTSGHRAYPYHYWDMDDLYDGSDMDMPKPMSVLDSVDPPEGLRDHYQSRAAPKEVIDLLAMINLPKPKMTIARRI